MNSTFFIINLYAFTVFAKGIFTVSVLYTLTSSFLKGFKHVFICDAWLVMAAEVYLVGLGASLPQAAQLTIARKWAQKEWATASPTSLVHPGPLKFLLFCNTVICYLDSAAYLQHSPIIHISFLILISSFLATAHRLIENGQSSEPSYNLECCQCSFRPSGKEGTGCSV